MTHTSLTSLSSDLLQIVGADLVAGDGIYSAYYITENGHGHNIVKVIIITFTFLFIKTTWPFFLN